MKNEKKRDDEVEISRDEYERAISNSPKYTSLLVSPDRDFLLSPDDTQVKVSDLEGKVIGIYFSANWYPPCRSFNNLLINTYEQLKSCNSEFEIVFVSSDEDVDAFNTFRAGMPWLAIPFSDVEAKKALNGRFDVEGIPCLVILQPNNNKDDATLHDGVELIYRYGVQAFPFTKERLEELQEEERKKQESQTISSLLVSIDRDVLLSHPNNKQVPIASLVGKTIGLYFSAKWCIPGMKFTPKLISIYKKIKELLREVVDDDQDFEIVYVSNDSNEIEFKSEFNTMPWLALPFGDDANKNLAKYFDVRGIPSLIILGPNGKTVTKNGRNLINLYQQNAYPFTEARVDMLEKKMDDEAKNLPKSEFHAGHKHELSLVSQGSGGGPFICCDCEEQGSGWAYQCIQCGYEVHPKCVKAVERDAYNSDH
ncbi:Thioredoxin, nucleoredoxin [Heracleum sosnowskyi]|uniref:protein-disulfide reductase n=1 Tax=Heracleum sosnowskyi TaxID=360622 RepID=A0AAD8MXD9_9APIA|nr:Thioredoxin, nucleoredoxin [Heracleum sosnowskyi]